MCTKWMPLSSLSNTVLTNAGLDQEVYQVLVVLLIVI
jgi:hypothetical protein